MKIVITTQDYQNKGNEKEPHWRADGGETYYCPIPLDVAMLGHTALEDLVGRVLASNINTDNEYYRCYVIGWSIEEDDYRDELWVMYDTDGDTYPVREVDLLGQRYYQGRIVSYRHGEVHHDPSP